LTDREPSDIEGISVYFKVMRSRNAYNSVYRNGIKSLKKKGTYEGNCIKFEGYENLKFLGEEEDLKQMAEVMPNRIDNVPSIKRMIKMNQKKKIQVSKLADVAKKAVWPALVFNLSIEPAFKFNLCVFGDKSSDVQSRTSYLT
jgi:hypothetical protein